MTQNPGPAPRTEEADEGAPPRRAAVNPFDRRTSARRGPIAEWGLFLAVVGAVASVFGVLMVLGALFSGVPPAGRLPGLIVVAFVSGLAAILCGGRSGRTGPLSKWAARAAVWIGSAVLILALVLHGTVLVFGW
jgi:hypothetical protein